MSIIDRIRKLDDYSNILESNIKLYIIDLKQYQYCQNCHITLKRNQYCISCESITESCNEDEAIFLNYFNQFKRFMKNPDSKYDIDPDELIHNDLFTSCWISILVDDFFKHKNTYNANLLPPIIFKSQSKYFIYTIVKLYIFLKKKKSMEIELKELNKKIIQSEIYEIKENKKNLFIPIGNSVTRSNKIYK